MPQTSYIRIVVERGRRDGMKVKVVCLECGKKFLVGAKSVCPKCPKCGGVDVEVEW